MTAISDMLDSKDTTISFLDDLLPLEHDAVSGVQTPKSHLHGLNHTKSIPVKDAPQTRKYEGSRMPHVRKLSNCLQMSSAFH